ncbi:MAG: hypothetical protein LBG43_09380 [Treponema sp.]|jgi:hypothetical protein|nr:hypothetical protein [Treponema sp.]
MNDIAGKKNEDAIQMENNKLVTSVSDDVFIGSGWSQNERDSSELWKWMSHPVSYIYVNNQWRNVRNITLELSNSYPRSGNDPISFCVFLNKEYIFDAEMHDTGAQRIELGKIPASNLIEIEVYVDKLWRPSDCGGADGDHRLLGLALTNITVSRTREGGVISEGCKDMTVISDDVFIGAGWLGNERNFPDLWKWSCSPTSCIYVNNQYKDLQSVALGLINSYPGSAADPVSCSVAVNKRISYNLEIKDTGMQRIEIDKIPDAELIEIELLVNKLWRPCDYENSGDSRLLGLAVRNIEVSRKSRNISPVSENERALKYFNAILKYSLKSRIMLR